MQKDQISKDQQDRRFFHYSKKKNWKTQMSPADEFVLLEFRIRLQSE